MTKIFSVLCLHLILVKSGSTGDEFQSIYLDVAAKLSHARVDHVIAMSAPMAFIKNCAALFLRLAIVTILRTNQMEIAWAEFIPFVLFDSGAPISLAVLPSMLLHSRKVGRVVC